MEHALDAARSNRGWTLRPLPLGPLASDATAVMARQLLCDQALGERLASSIARESAGSPFFAGELARFVRAADLPELGTIALSAVLAARFDALPPSARRLLEMIGLVGQPLPVDAVLPAADASHDDLAVLQSGSLVRASNTSETGRWVECYHDRIRESVAARISDACPTGHFASDAHACDAITPFPFTAMPVS